MGTVSSGGGAANASEKTLLVLEAAILHSRFSDIVEATGLAKATTHRILGTLVARGFLIHGDSSYLPGPRTVAMAGSALQRIDISAIAGPYAQRLVERVRCTVHVGAANGDEIVYLVRADSDKPYQMPSRVGLSIPMHTSGIGKAILAGRTDEEIAAYAARTGLPPETPHSITALPALLTDVAEIRRRGYSLDREENVPGIVCVAAPIRDHTGEAKYGISVSSITLEHSVDQIEDFAHEVVATADAISTALGAR